MSDFKWENPPTDKVGRGQQQVDHYETAAKLRKRPLAWAVIGRYDDKSVSSSMASMIKGGKYTAYGKGYEAVARAVDVIEGGIRTRQYRVYARFVGEAESDV